MSDDSGFPIRLGTANADFFAAMIINKRLTAGRTRIWKDSPLELQFYGLEPLARPQTGAKDTDDMEESAKGITVRLSTT